MAVDTDKLIAHLNKCSADVKAAVDEFASVERMTVIESYIMGHLRSVQAVLTGATDFVAQCGAYKNVRSADKKPKALPQSVPEPEQLTS